MPVISRQRFYKVYENDLKSIFCSKKRNVPHPPFSQERCQDSVVETVSSPECLEKEKLLNNSDGTTDE